MTVEEIRRELLGKKKKKKKKKKYIYKLKFNDCKLS